MNTIPTSEQYTILTKDGKTDEAETFLNSLPFKNDMDKQAFVLMFSYRAPVVAKKKNKVTDIVK